MADESRPVDADDTTPDGTAGDPGSGAAPEAGGSAPIRPARSRGMTILLLSAAAVVLLLVGATLGLALSGTFRSTEQTPDSASVDAGFARDMIVHHDQGVLMAHYAEQNTTDSEIAVMAYDIGYTQTDQIGQMQGWLSLWDLPDATDAPRMSWMQGADHSGHDMSATTTGTAAGSVAATTGPSAGGSGGQEGSGLSGTAGMTGMAGMSGSETSASGSAPATSADQTPLMPGMATDSEIARLKALRGTESDVYFLQLMIRHHQGGAPMMQYAAQHATNPMVRNFADKMAQTQDAEISVMTQMLAERGAEPLPAPTG